MSLIKYTSFIAIIGLILACNASNKSKEQISKETTKKPTLTAEVPKVDTVVQQSFSTHNVPWSEIQGLGKVPFDYQVPYGEEELQIGELRTPLTQDTFPLVIFIHGGCWLADFDLDHVSAVCANLVEEGYAVWTPEYRRVGNEGGGYPGTFQDIQASVDFARTLADIYPLDLDNVILMGHSAGGHLALWLATQHNLPTNSRLFNENPLLIKGVIALAGITDLIAYDKVGNSCSSAVTKLMGGDSERNRNNYLKGSPIKLLPVKVPVRLVHGDLDNIVPIQQSTAFAEKAKGDVEVITIEGGGHFDMVSPYSAAWQVIKQELAELVD